MDASRGSSARCVRAERCCARTVEVPLRGIDPVAGACHAVPTLVEREVGVKRPVNLSVYNSGVLATASPEGALNRQTARDFRSYERTAGVTPPERAGASTDAAVVTPAGS